MKKEINDINWNDWDIEEDPNELITQNTGIIIYDTTSYYTSNYVYVYYGYDNCDNYYDYFYI